jgi:hypothetical protein
MPEENIPAFLATASVLIPKKQVDDIDTRWLERE